MSGPGADLQARIAAKTEQLGQLVARLHRFEQRAAMKERERQKRSDRQRRLELGAAVIRAGCGHWSVPELVGVLLDARDRVGGSSTQMLGMRKRGDAHLGRQATDAPPTTVH